jgi:hypothetical protein
MKKIMEYIVDVLLMALVTFLLSCLLLSAIDRTVEIREQQIRKYGYVRVW